MAITLDGTSGITATGSLTGLTTPLAVNQGGTGAATLTANNVLLGNGTSAVQAVAPGTSGNVLTSDGTTWTSSALPAGGVTSLNGQTGAITNTDYGAIGSYVIATLDNFTNNFETAINSTHAGSNLLGYNNSGGSTTVSRPLNASAQSSISNSSGTASSLGLSGTWRAMTYGRNGSTGQAPVTLFVRIS